MEVTRDARASARTFGRAGRWRARGVHLVSVLLCLYILVVASGIIYRHPMRYDLTEERLHALSDRTLARLGLVRETIRVLLPYHQQPGNPEHAARVRVLDRALRVLEEFSAAQPLIRLEAKVNVYREAERWKKLCDRYDLSPDQFNRLIFLAGEKGELRASVTPTDLASFGRSRDPRTPPQIKAFRGEEAMARAIQRLIDRTRKKVCFLQGHGELVLRPAKGRAPALGALRHDLDSSGYEAVELSLTGRREIPGDCDLLVVAGPEQPFSRREIDLIEKYLVDEGRLLVTLGTKRTGIEDLLERWGVRVGEGTIRSRWSLPGERVERDWVEAGGFNGAHPVTRPFANASRFEIRLFAPRPLEVRGGKRRLRTEPLLHTGGNSDAEKFVLQGGEETTDRDRARGDFVLATATQDEILDNPPPDWKHRATRIVVVGGSSFLRDSPERSEVQGGYLSASHRDFVINAAHWLAGDETLVALGGQETLQRELPPMRGSLSRFLFLTSVLVFPGIFLFLGIGVYFLRRA